MAELMSEAASFARRDLTELAGGGAAHTIHSLLCCTVELAMQMGWHRAVAWLSFVLSYRSQVTAGRTVEFF